MGKPKARQEDDVKNDITKVGIGNWRQVVQNEEE
jgi:hypothetical protein